MKPGYDLPIMTQVVPTSASARAETVIIVTEDPAAPPEGDEPRVPQSVTDLQSVLQLMSFIRNDLNNFSVDMAPQDRALMLATARTHIDESIRFLNRYVASPEGGLSDSAAAARNMALSVYLAVDEAERNNSDEYPQRMVAGVDDARRFIKRAAHPVDSWLQAQVEAAMADAPRQ